MRSVRAGPGKDCCQIIGAQGCLTNASWVDTAKPRTASKGRTPSVAPPISLETASTISDRSSSRFATWL